MKKIEGLKLDNEYKFATIESDILKTSSDKDLTVLNLKHIAEELQNYKKIEGLTISGRDKELEKERAEILAQIIRTHISIDYLHISNYKKCASLFKQYLNSAILALVDLKRLTIENVEIQDGGLISLFQGLKINTKIDDLFLARTSISTGAIVELGKLLEINNSIKYLTIDEPSISEEGVMKLFEGIKLNKSLKHLIFSNDKMINIAEKAGKSIMDVMIHNSTIILIDGLKFANGQDLLVFKTLLDSNEVQKEYCHKSIKDYKCVRILGHGNLGRTYLAINNGVVHHIYIAQKLRAIKELELGGNSFVDSKYEIAIMKHLPHRNLIDVLDSFTYQDSLYIVMDLFPSALRVRNFNNELREVTTTDKLRIFRELCEGMEHMHNSGIAHLALKPQNIFLTSNDNIPNSHIKISDFGIANLSQTDTYLNTTKGTAEYVAPEIWGMEENLFHYEPDIFSLGVIFHEIEWGKKPFTFNSNGDVIELSKDIMDKEFIPPKNYRPEDGASYFEKIVNLVSKMLIKESRNRIKVHEVLKIIHKLYFEYPIRFGKDYQIMTNCSFKEFKSDYEGRKLGEGNFGLGAFVYRTFELKDIESYTMSYINTLYLQNHTDFLKAKLENNLEQYEYKGKGVHIYIGAKSQLSEILKDQTHKIEKELMIRWLLRIICALEYASQNGIHHGNLTTSTVFLDQDNNIKLVGFSTNLNSHIDRQKWDSDSDISFGSDDEDSTPKEGKKAKISELLIIKLPITAVSQLNIKEDIKSIMKIWINIILFEKVNNSNLHELINLMPTNYQEIISSIMLDNTSFSYAELKKNLYRIFIEEIQNEIGLSPQHLIIEDRMTMKYPNEEKKYSNLNPGKVVNISKKEDPKDTILMSKGENKIRYTLINITI